MKDLAKNYDVTKHPKYMSGEYSETRVLREFLKTFEAEGNVDGIVISSLSIYLSLFQTIDMYFGLSCFISYQYGAEIHIDRKISLLISTCIFTCVDTCNAIILITTVI